MLLTLSTFQSQQILRDLRQLREKIYGVNVLHLISFPLIIESFTLSSTIYKDYIFTVDVLNIACLVTLGDSI